MLFFFIFVLVMSFLAVKAVLLERKGGKMNSELNNNQLKGKD